MPRRLGGKSVQERVREEKRERMERELEARAPRRWPVANLHHPLPGPGSRAHLCQKERPATRSVM